MEHASQMSSPAGGGSGVVGHPRFGSPIARLTSAEGFADYYLRMDGLYPSQREAYECLEDFHIQVTGRRRYSEFDSFRKILKRQLRKARRQSE